jgi:signal transduction histidine kinase/CheY-like chemotaxis protein
LGDELAQALRAEDVARIIVAAAIATLGADDAGVWIVDGEVARLIAADHPTTRQLYASVPLDGTSPIATVINSGQAEWVKTRAELAARFPAYEAAAFLVLPLTASGLIRGAVGIAFKIEREFPTEDHEFLVSLTRHAAIALERARFYDEAAKRQRHAEASAQRLEKLREAMEALAGARTSGDVAKVAVEAGGVAVGATSATMWLLDPDDDLLKLAASHNVADNYLSSFRVIRPDSRLAIARVVATRTPMFVADELQLARDAPEAYPHMRDAGQVHPFAVLPLATEERVLGAIAFTFAGARHEVVADERELLFGLTRSCEQALERARLLEVEAEARRVAEAASQRKDELLAMLSHELRNPLAAMTTAVDIIKMREGTLGREMTILDRHLTSLTRMVSDLLDVSRVTMGKIELVRETTSVKPAVEQGVETVRALLDSRQHVLAIDVADGLAVNADAERFVQVISNLVSNAAQYTPEGGRIYVRAREDGDDTVIEVRDNGVGISATLMPTIFDAFVQGPRKLDRQPGGLGIGLTLVRQLVELHGGRVTVHSDGEGQGSTFTLRWPRASGRTSTVKMTALNRPEPLRVLVIEHDIDVAQAFARTIEGLGHDVVIVHDANDALAAGDGFSADVVFVDLEVGGYELAKRLRALPALVGGRIIALGPPGSRNAERELEAGVTQHATRPVDLRALTVLLSLGPLRS